MTMYYIMVNDKETLILPEVTRTEVNENKGYIKFFNKNELVALFRLSELKGFYESVIREIG